MVSENQSTEKNSTYLRPPPNLALLLNQFNNTSASKILIQKVLQILDILILMIYKH